MSRVVLYSTPAFAFRTEDGLVFGVIYGAASDWVKNALVVKQVQVKRLGVTRDYEEARLVDAGDARGLIPGVFRVGFRLLRVRHLLLVSDTKRAGPFE